MIIFKILKYVIFIIFLGLVQFWFLALILYFKSISFELNLLLKDGGIFFFSTSLVFSSLYLLIEQGIDQQIIVSGVKREAIQVISIVVSIVVTSFAVIGYSVEFSGAIEDKVVPDFSTDKYPLAQFICLLSSVTYALYVSAVTGTFLKKT